MHVFLSNYAFILLLCIRVLFDHDGYFLAINANKCCRLRIIGWLLF